MVFVEHGRPLATEVLGKAWSPGEGFYECVGGNDFAERLLGRCVIGPGDFAVTARLALFKSARSAAAFTLGDGNAFGFAGAHGKIFVTGPWFDNARGKPIGEPADFFTDGVPFDFDFRREGDQLRVAIDGKKVYEQKVSTGSLGAVGFSPVRSTMRILRFSATGNLGAYRAPSVRRKHSGKPVPDPRLALLPKLPQGPFVRLGDGGIMGVGERQALVSYDDGESWEKRPIFAPNEKFTIRPERALLRTRGGAIILIFANGAVQKYSWDRKKNAPLPDMHLPSYAIRSLDEGRTWTDLTLLHDFWCGCIQDIVQTRTGNVVVPGQELLAKEARHATMPYVSRDDGKTWLRTRYLDIGGRGDHAGAIEGTLEQLRDGRLWILLRSYHGFFYESFSADEGLTWTDPRLSRIRSTGSPGKMKRLVDGRLALLWNAIPNPGFARREELSLSFSADDGKTWTPPQVIARHKGGRVAYPHLFEHSPGKLWVTTMQGALRASLKTADFDKKWTKIVAFGDSTTAMRGKLTVYADRLESGLRRGGTDAWVINSGVGGNTTRDARNRLQQDVLAHTPALVLIQFGINDSAVDVWRNPPAAGPRVPLAAYKANLEYLVAGARAAGARVLLLTPNPLRWSPGTRKLYGKPPYDAEDPDGFNVLLREFAAVVREVARAKSVGLVDVYSRFEAYAAEDGQTMDDLLSDGMHPNAKGHGLVAELLLPRVTAVLGR